MNAQRVMEVVADTYGLTIDQLINQDRHAPLPEARQMIYTLLYGNISLSDISELIKRDRSTIINGVETMNSLLSYDARVIETMNEVREKLNLQKDMTIKLSYEQVSGLHTLITAFLRQTEPTNEPERLIYLHLDTINEKARKKLRAHNKNLALDDKEQSAFAIWQPTIPAEFQRWYEYEYNITRIMLDQIKPM